MGGKNKSKSKQQSSSSGVSANSGMGINYGVNTAGNQSSNQASNQSSSQGNSSNFTSSGQDIWGGQVDSLENLYAQNTDQYNQAISGINGLQPQVQQQVQDAYGNAADGYNNQSGGGFAAGLQGMVGPNAYTGALKQNIADDAQLLKQQNLGGLDARAAAAGMSGSSGYHDQSAKMADNVDQNALQQMSQLDFNAQNAGVANQMALASSMDQNQQFAAGGASQLQNAAMSQFNPFMSGMQATGMYGDIIGAPTTLSSSSGGGVSNNSSSSNGMSQGNSSGFSNGMNVGLNTQQGTNITNSSGLGNSSSSGWNVQYPGA